MDSSTSEVVHDFTPYFRVYKDGRIERLKGTDIVPPSADLRTRVQSKDILISPKTGASARLFIPKITNPTQKLPLLIYFHGGAFCVQSAFSPIFQNYLTSLVAEANVVALSVNYRLAPEYPLPIAYDDSWAALQLVASHSNGQGRELWLKDHVDFERVFMAGDSAGANIAHNTAIRVGEYGLAGVKLVGLVLVHPFFGHPDFDKLWMYLCPSSSGCDDPRLNPAADTRLSSMGCSRVLVCVAEKDKLRDRGCSYGEILGKSGWGGTLEIVETEGEDHVFHLFNSTCEKAATLLKRLAAFMNQD